jgi:MinD-like ATPase involved in chromosome partitioning or flagellar assembly
VGGDSEDLAAALRAAGVRSPAPPPASVESIEASATARQGEVVVFIGPPHGKSGQTRCAIEVGRVLGEAARTLVIDAVSDEPALAAALGLRPERNLARVAAAGSGPERAHVLREVAQPLEADQPSRAMALAGVPGAAQRARVSPGFLSELLDQVAGPGGYRYVLVDAGAEPPGGTPASAWWRALLEAADRVLLVIEPDLVGLRRALGTLERVQDTTDHRRVAVILNRYQAGAHDAAAEIARLLDGVPVVGVVPLDERGCATALHTQRPLGALGRSPAAAEFRRIADELRRHPTQPRLSWWRRLTTLVRAKLAAVRARRPGIGHRDPSAGRAVPSASPGAGADTRRRARPASRREQAARPPAGRAQGQAAGSDGGAHDPNQ